MSFPFSSTLNSFFLPALNLAAGRSDTTTTNNTNLLEISDVNISDLSIIDDPVTAETSLIVRVQHRSSHRSSPYRTSRPIDMLSIPKGKGERSHLTQRHGNLHMASESPILVERRRTLSEPSMKAERSIQSVSQAGKYKCVYVKSPGLVVHPEDSSPVLFLADGLPHDNEKSTLEAALKQDLRHSCTSRKSCSCESIVVGDSNPVYGQLLSTLNDQHASRFEGANPGWNALRIISATSNEPPSLEPHESGFCLLHFGGRDTLHIFPSNKSSSAHKLILEVPLGPLAVVHIPTVVVSGNRLTLYRAPNLDQDAPRSFQVIPVKLENPIPTVTSTKPLTPPGNAKVSSTSGSPGSCVEPNVGAPNDAQSSSPPTKLLKGPNDVPPSDLKDTIFAIPTNLLPPLPPSPTNENLPSQRETIPSPCVKDGAVSDVSHKEHHLSEPPNEVPVLAEVPSGSGSLTEPHVSTCDMKSVDPTGKPPEPQPPDTGHGAELTISPDGTPSDAGDDTRPEEPLIPDTSDAAPLQAAPSDSDVTRACTEPIITINRPVGRFVPEEFTKLILEKIKPPDLQVLCNACGISNKSAASGIKALITSKLQSIHDGKSALSETLATEVVNKLTSLQINTLLNRGNVKFNKRAIVFDRKKILLDYWLLRTQKHADPPAKPKKQKGKRGKKKTKNPSFNNTLPAECVQSTSESKQECETKTQRLPPSLDPIREEESSQEELQDPPGTSAVPTSPTEASEQQLFLLEKSILELRTDMDKNTHCLDLLLDEDPRKGSRQLPGVDDLRKLIKSETQPLADRCDSLQDLAREIQQLCQNQGALIRELQEELSSLRQSGQNSYNAVVSGRNPPPPNSARGNPPPPSSDRGNPPPRSSARGNPPSISSARGNPPPPSSARGNPRHKTKAVILHDGTYDNFDQSMFASRYEVETFNCSSLRKAASDERILRRVLDGNPFAVIVHLGTKDLYEGRSVNSTLKDAEYVIANLTKSAHTCMSLPIIPCSTEHKSFTDKLSHFNQKLTDQITNWRRSPMNGMKMKVFTCQKPMLTPSTRIFSSEPHLKVITESGRKKLWLKLRDAMDRISGLRPPREHRSPNTDQDPPPRETYRHSGPPRDHRPTQQANQDHHQPDTPPNNTPNDE